MKIVIHTWTHNFNIDQEHLKKYNYYNETNFFFGLGDLIRSTIKLFYLSKKMNFRLIVDIQLHPISHFLKNEKHEYSDIVLKNKDNIDYVCYGGVEDYINQHNDNEIMFILTNDFCEEQNINNECKDFIKKILTPKHDYELFIQRKMKTIPYSNFNILHYRLNDEEFLKKKSSVVFDEVYHNMQKNKEWNDILITDTSKFKQFVFLKNNPVFMFDIKICHLGLSKNLDEIRDTLFEFFLITKCSKIKTYCKIHEMSGFVKWISKIYDIPIHKI
jgi:hypothetical protein